jgi:hypothetical protein
VIANAKSLKEALNKELNSTTAAELGTILGNQGALTKAGVPTKKEADNMETELKSIFTTADNTRAGFHKATVQVMKTALDKEVKLVTGHDAHKWSEHIEKEQNFEFTKVVARASIAVEDRKSRDAKTDEFRKLTESLMDKKRKYDEACGTHTPLEKTTSESFNAALKAASKTTVEGAFMDGVLYGAPAEAAGTARALMKALNVEEDDLLLQIKEELLSIEAGKGSTTATTANMKAGSSKGGASVRGSSKSAKTAGKQQKQAEAPAAPVPTKDKGSSKKADDDGNASVATATSSKRRKRLA